MKIRIEIVEAEPIPNGYGLAWRDFPRRVTICYPIPLNLILNLLRRLWHWSLLSFQMKHSAIDKVFQEGRRSGIRDTEVRVEQLRQFSYDKGVKDGSDKVADKIRETVKQIRNEEDD